MRRSKQDYIIIAFALLLLCIILFLLYLATRPSVKPSPITPTPTPLKKTTNGKPALLYDITQQNKLLGYVQNRRPISNNDKLAKATVLATLPQGEQSGILMESKNIRIDYIHSADLFQVEILTTDIQTAKNEANLWFRTRGFSQKAICEMPVGFYMNFDVANIIRQTDYVFDPLGNGC